MSRFVMIDQSPVTRLVFRFEIMEERAHILGQQFGFLQRGEMPTSWHLRPALDAQVALRQFARKGDPWGEIFGEAGKPRWNVNTPPRREGLRHGQVLVVVA